MSVDDTNIIDGPESWKRPRKPQVWSEGLRELGPVVPREHFGTKVPATHDNVDAMNMAREADARRIAIASVLAGNPSTTSPKEEALALCMLIDMCMKGALDLSTRTGQVQWQIFAQDLESMSERASLYTSRMEGKP